MRVAPNPSRHVGFVQVLYLIPVRSTVRLRQQGEEEELLSPAGLLSEADPKHLFQFLPTLLDLEEARGVRQGLAQALSLSENQLLLYKQSLLSASLLPSQPRGAPRQHSTEPTLAKMCLPTASCAQGCW